MFIKLIFSTQLRYKNSYWISYTNYTHLLTFIISGCRFNRLIIDSIEMPDPNDRTSFKSRNLNFILKFFLKHTDKFIGHRCYKVVTNAYPVKLYLEKWYNREVEYITNFDDTYRPPTIQKQKYNIAIPAALYSNTGIYFCRDTIPYIPSEWNLHFIGLGKNSMSYIQNKFPHTTSLHYTPHGDRDTYLKAISRCSIGWILFDTKIKNCLLTTPNRLIDMKLFNLPIVHTGMLGVQHFKDPRDVETRFNDVDDLILKTQEAFRREETIHYKFKNDSNTWNKFIKEAIPQNSFVNIIAFTRFNEFRISLIERALINANLEYNTEKNLRMRL